MSAFLGARFMQRAAPIFGRQYSKSPAATPATMQRNVMQASKRFQSTNATTEAKESFWKKSWESPIGIRTVHFWAPIMKWILVIAGIGEFARPADRLSLPQNAALACTGVIWTRWCMIIKPRNVLLATVNFFLGCVGLTQLSRIGIHRWNTRSEAEKSESQPQTEEKNATN